MPLNIFMRSLAPLVTLRSNKDPAAVKLSTIFRPVPAASNKKLSTTLYKSEPTVALVLRGWDDERSESVDPLEPDLDKINPILRIWLERLGLKEDDVYRFAECKAESQRPSFLVLLRDLPKAPRALSYLIKILIEGAIKHCSVTMIESDSKARDSWPIGQEKTHFRLRGKSDGISKRSQTSHRVSFQGR